MFRKIGKHFRNLLTREYDLEEQLRLCRDQGTVFQFENEAFFEQIDPTTSGLEEAKSSGTQGSAKNAAQALLEHFCERLRPQAFLHPGEVEGIAEALRAHPQDCRRWVQSAEAAVQHRFTPLQGEELQFPKTIDWYSDFCGGSWMMAPREVLRQHLAERTLEFEQQEGLRRSWSFNELGHLVDLGRSFWITGNESYASECIVQSVDWAERNPVFLGMSWYHPKVVAQRNLHWLLVIQHLLLSDLMQGELLVRMLKMALAHLGYLALGLRDGESQGYRLSCAASLYLVCGHLPEFAPLKRWQALARQHLHLAAEDDFGKDGFHRSGNLSLHREALDWLMLCHSFDLINSRSSELHQVCEDALDALLYLRPPAGQSGESGATLSEGVLGRGCGPLDHVHRLLSLGSLVFQRGDLHPGGEPPAELIWWIGPEATARGRQLTRQEPRGIRRLFQQAQVAVVRDHWGPRCNWCQLKGYPTRQGEGPYAPPAPLSWPHHDDALSFTLTLDGEPLLIEPGGPAVGGELARLFSKLGTHCAVRIGRELEPLDLAPELAEPSEQPRLKLESCREGHYLCAIRPVWMEFEQPYWLTREVLFLPKKHRVVIRDHLDGEGEVHWESNLLLAPHLDILMRGDMGSLLRGKKLQARILPLFPARFRYEVLKGRTQGLQGFFWSESARAVPTHLLRYFARLQLPATVSTWIAWDPEDTLTPRPQDVEKLFRSR